MCFLLKEVKSEINEDSKAFIIAQAPGKCEDDEGKPLIGSGNKSTAGYILRNILTELGFNRSNFCYGNTYGFFPGEDENSSHDKKPTKKQQIDYADTLYKNIEESKVNKIITLGNEAKAHLEWMAKQDKYPLISEILKTNNILNARYPNNQFKEELRTQLTKFLNND